MTPIPLGNDSPAPAAVRPLLKTAFDFSDPPRRGVLPVGSPIRVGGSLARRWIEVGNRLVALLGLLLEDGGSIAKTLRNAERLLREEGPLWRLGREDPGVTTLVLKRAGHG